MKRLLAGRSLALILGIALVSTEAFGLTANEQASSIVHVVVEVASPTTERTDRLFKAEKYAEAGIPGYWRVETEPEVTLTAYTLDPGTTSYTELGTWSRGQTATIERPFPARITIDDLIP